MFRGNSYRIRRNPAGKLAGSAVLLVLAASLMACGGESSTQAFNAGTSPLHRGAHPAMDADCEAKRHRQLDELLALHMRHMQEMRDFRTAQVSMTGSSLMQAQLQSARQALEQAQLNYAHAKEDVRMDCRPPAMRA